MNNDDNNGNEAFLDMDDVDLPPLDLSAMKSVKKQALTKGTFSQYANSTVFGIWLQLMLN